MTYQSPRPLGALALRRLAKFLASRRGNITLMFAAAFPLLVFTVGGAIDLTRAMSARSDLARAVESAALASASITNDRDVEDIVADYIRVNVSTSRYGGATPVVSIEGDTAINARTRNITATLSIDMTFMKLLGFQSFDVSASATAVESRQNIEISMVLDISSSMRGARIANLRTASEDFVAAMLDGDKADTTSINLIPFGGTVNIGDVFDRFAVSSAAATVDPTSSQYNIGPNVLSSPFRFSDGHNCIELTNDDYSSSALLPNESRGQVPLFWKWWRVNPWCPDPNTAAVFNSNNASTLEARITSMNLSDGTGMDIGAYWGYQALSPTWVNAFGGDFAGRPAALNDEVIKVLVVMTDGGITAQFRPRDYTYYSVHTNRDISTDTTQEISNSGNNSNQQSIVSKGGAGAASNSNTAVGRFKRVCDQAKNDGIIVYTIGFQIADGSLQDKMLEYCASDISKYFFVESLDIDAAFEAIAASVNALRIAG